MKRTCATDGRPVLRFASGLEIRIGNLLAAGGLVAILLLVAIISAGSGTANTGAGDLLRRLAGASLSPEESYALMNVRLPRIVLAFMAGWAVALAGAILQSIARNPLADPGLFGLSQGSVTTIMLLLIFVPAAPKSLVVLAAIGGALAVAVLLIWLTGGARSGGLAILLMGIAIETVLSSAASILILYTPAETSLALAEWMAGSLFQASWPSVTAFAPFFGFSLIGIFLAGRVLSAFDLGTEMAMSIGEPVGLSRPLVLFLAVVLSASAVTAVGPLMFLGVLAPQLAGFISPATGRARLVLSALTGGILVVGADALARGFAADMPLPTGLGLTLTGVPLFILALRFQSLRRLQAP